MIHHITRATRHLIFWSLIAAAVGLTGVRFLLWGIDHYKSDLANTIGTLAGTPVRIGRLGAKMRGFNPQLVLKDLTIASIDASEKPAIELSEIRLGVNLPDLLLKRDLLSSSWVTLVGAKLSVKRQQDGSIAVVGLKAGDGQPTWLLQGARYQVLQSEISWLDEKNHSRPLTFSGVDLAILNEGEHHRLNVLIRLPQKIGDKLRVSADFTGNIFEPSTVQGRVYVEGRAVSLAESVAGLGLVPPPVPSASANRTLSGTEAWDRIQLKTGTGDFKIWADWRQAQLMSMDVSAQIQQMQLVRQDKQEFFVKHLATRLHWGLGDAVNGTNSQWRLDVNDFSLETQDSAKNTVKNWPAALFSVVAQHTDSHAVAKIALFVQQLDLQEASELVRFFAPLPQDQADTLAQAQLKGRLENFSLFADPDAKAVALNGTFSHINVASLFSVPGIENLSGHIKGDEKQGVINVSTEEARLSSPDLFREVLPVKRLQGQLNWRQTEELWSLSSRMLALDSLSFQSKTRFRIDIPKTDKPVFMDLQSSFAGEDAREVTHFLPVGIMGKEVVAWLDHAFIGGSMTHGGVLVYGNLIDFPFTRAPGVFEALFNGENFELSYAPTWPHISDMNAEVLFLQDSLKVNILHGQSGAMAIKQAEVTIPVLNKSKQVLIQGEAEGGIDQVLAFMQQTPLSSPVDSLLEAITPQGNTQVELDLKIPLVSGEPTEVDGAVHLKDAKLNVKSLALPVSKINGDLKFNEQGVYSDTIHAAALGHPIQINIESSAEQTTVNVAGRVGVDDLQQQFDMPWWNIAEGVTDYRLKLALPYGNSAPELLVDSMLSGVSLNLPETLAKTREQSVPLSLTFRLSDNPLMPVLLNYDNRVKAAMQLDTGKKSLYSGHVVVGKGEANQNRDAGLKLEINRDRLPLQDWLGLAAAQGAGDGVTELKIHSDHALWKTSDLGSFDLALKPNGNYWNGTLVGSFAKGSIRVPNDFKSADRLYLDMELLDLSALKQAGTKASTDVQTLSPERVPLLTVTSQKTLWQSVDLGRLFLATERIPGGIGFKQVELTGENQRLVLSGDWRTAGSQSLTHAHGHMDVPRAGTLLSQLNITKDLTETSAAVDFSVHWNAAPYQFSLADLNGRVDISFKSGRILSIEPGFGRVLGMLALAQWVKRAQLDFSDIYQEGLTFNSIKGHFDLAGGIASTHDLVVDAIPAKIAISGDTDLVNRTLDQIVDVTPKSADAVPIAGTIMGKVAALVGRSLTGKDQEGFFFGSQYQVKGAWGNAEIIPMHKNDGLLQKTWNGITDFPWLKQKE